MAIEDSLAARRVLIVTGIYPPDIGGPATHADDVKRELEERGRSVRVLTLTDGGRTVELPGVTRFPRRWPWPLRMLVIAAWMVRGRSTYDVVYATGMQSEAVLGARLAGRPIVAKFVGDPAWERASHLRLTQRGFDEFQAARALSWRVRSMVLLRTLTARSATALIAPSDYLAGVVGAWIRSARPVRVVPNGVRMPVTAEPRASASPVLRLLSVGRLIPHKRVDLLVRALAQTRDARLVVVGEGKERAALEALAVETGVRDRVAFEGSLAHEQVMHRLGDADALVLVSSYEGLPHVVIEAMVAGTPVITSGAGGTTEVVRDGENGLLVEGTVDELSAAVRRLEKSPQLLAQLKRGAVEEGARWSIGSTVDQLCEVFDVVGRGTATGRRPT